MRDEPILILTTGGTIDKQYFDSLSKYQIVETVIPRLLTVAKVTHPYQLEEVLRKDSLELTQEDREVLAQRVRNSKARRIIITHGTDTMAATAQHLSQVPDKTIVLIGALAPARFSESDAAFNLGMAFAAAQLAPPGVYVTMNGSVFDGLRVRKDYASASFKELENTG